MKPRLLLLVLFACAASGYASPPAEDVHFQTSDRCAACHNGLVAPSGERISIGLDWSTSVMANSARDPYWQASVRREPLDHPQQAAVIEDECAACHMPMPRYRARMAGHRSPVFAVLSAPPSNELHQQGLDGVSCSVCHQMSPQGLGSEATWNGQFMLSRPVSGRSLEYGPFPIDPGLLRIMRSSSGGFEPTQGEHIRQSELCATCHTLITETLGPGGREVGRFPEQMPYQEWLHSDYPNTQSCQACHMRLVEEPTAIARTFGVPRHGFMRHEFSGGNFFVVRDAGGLYVVSARCTHEGATCTVQTNQFYCPRHAAKFDLNGGPVSGPVVTALSHFAMCTLANGRVGVIITMKVAKTDRLVA